jgi:non-ribosomal peptide synthase protein (TIGR01720 family)
VPHGGLGYGVLRYLAPAEAGGELRRAPAAGALVNFLGRLDGAGRTAGPLRLAEEDPGPARSPRNPRGYPLEINEVVRGGRLTVDWTFDPRTHRPAAVERWAAGHLEALRELASAVAEAPRRAASAETAADPDLELAVDLAPGELDSILEQMGDAGEGAG